MIVLGKKTAAHPRRCLGRLVELKGVPLIGEERMIYYYDIAIGLHSPKP